MKKKELEKGLQPVFDKFLSEMLIIETSKDNELKYATKQGAKANELIRSLEIEKKENKEVLQKEINTSKNKQNLLDDAHKKLSDETTKQTILNGKIQSSLTKTETNERETQEIKNAIAKELEAKLKLKETLKNKHESLKEDFDKLDNRTKALNDSDSKLPNRELLASRKEEENVNKSCDLSQREIKIRANEKSIKLQWDRIDAAK